MSDIFSIYYDHYGKDEIIASKKIKSAKLLQKFLFDEYHMDHYQDHMDIFFQNTNEIFSFLQEISDFIFNNEYVFKSKQTRLYMIQSMKLSVLDIINQQIDRNTIRNVYSIVAL